MKAAAHARSFVPGDGNIRLVRMAEVLPQLHWEQGVTDIEFKQSVTLYE